jgi:hypothetical protein
MKFSYYHFFHNIEKMAGVRTPDSTFFPYLNVNLTTKLLDKKKMDEVVLTHVTK